MNYSEKIRLKVPAKINLYLQVIGKRPDGYHDIDTLMQTVSLYDDLTLEKSDRIELVCDGVEGIKSEENLAYKAALTISDIAQYPGVKIILKKHIPQGAGLGGGSADAAFVVRGLIRLYKLKLDHRELTGRMASLGADIPFFLGTGQARATGIGDILEPLILPTDYQVLIIKPKISINTRWAYQNIKIRLTNNVNSIILDKRTNIADIVRLMSKIRNDFEEIAFAVSDDLAMIKKQLIRDKALYASMSGSGSAMFGVFKKTADLEPIAAKFSGNGFQTFICEPVVLPSIL
jgi:4-diphosphocytidyl-2-C-methyl-D-erythritol kinase